MVKESNVLKQINKDYLLNIGVITILLSAFFPYLYLFPTERDIQPTTFFIGIILFVVGLSKVRLKPIHYLSLLLTLISVLYLAFDIEYILTNYKEIIGYPIFTFLLIVFSIYSKKINKLLPNILLGSVIVWMLIGLVQVSYDPYFLDFLVREFRGVHINGRGVTGIACEPTEYGIQCVHFIVLTLLLDNNKWKKLLLIILLIQVLFFAKSTTILIIIIISIITSVLFKAKIIYFKLREYKSVIIFLTLIFIGSLFFSKRFKVSLNGLHSEGISYLHKDHSILLRASNVIIPFYSTIDNYGIGQGYGNYSDYIKSLVQDGKMSLLLNDNNKEIFDKNIKGSVSSAIFELGIFGLIIFLIVLYSFRNRFYDLESFFACILFLMTMLFTLSPLAFSCYPLIIAVANSENKPPDN